MIESSKDLLFIVLAFCAIWLTVFLCWLLYYAMALMRDVEVIMRNVRDAVEKVDKLAHLLHDKVEKSAVSLGFVLQAARELIMWALQQRREKSEAAAKSSAKSKKKLAKEDEELA